MEQMDIFSVMEKEKAVGSEPEKPAEIVKAKENKMESVLKNQPEKSKLHTYLDSLVEKYKTQDFITNDPIRFPHRYSDPKDQEIMGFIAAMMAQGKRTSIVANLEKLEILLQKKPYEFILNFDFASQAPSFADFNHFAYKNIPGSDVVCIIYLVKQALQKYGSLKKLFLEGLNPPAQKNVKEALVHFTETIFNFEPPPGMGPIPGNIKSLLPNPNKGSACKRLNMYLRWMVRKDNVDLGLWTEVPTSMLIIPLDFHVSKLSRELGLTSRKQDDWRTAEEITDNLKKFDPEDPTKYDFAIFGMGISGEKPFIPQ
jgi:uncharacterized protein (TIGR02757 family)